MWKRVALRYLRQRLSSNGRILTASTPSLLVRPPADAYFLTTPLSRLLSSGGNKQPPNRRRENRRQGGGERSSSGLRPDKQVLHELMSGIQSLRNVVRQLDPLPPVWSSEGATGAHPEAPAARAQVFADVQALVGQLEWAIRQKILRPVDQHGREISLILQDILQLYTESVADHVEQSGHPQGAFSSVYDAHNYVVDLMRKCNLERQQFHYQYGVEIAVRENKYVEAAEICWRQIDPTDGFGYAPCDVSVAEPVGLYALARAAQEQKTAVVESVMDGVLKMSMVSSTDQEKYILAAGTALGHAGEYEAFIEYLKTSYRASQLGQPLVAAVMHACLLCGRSEEALGVFDDFVSRQPAGASEWHWGGGEDVLHPLCRDLAMRALGDVGQAERAMEFYREVQAENINISVEAARGVVLACEREGQWEDAVLVWFSMLEKQNLCRLVPGDDLVVSDTVLSESETLSRMTELGAVLDPIMRACNSAGHFGVAMLCFHLLELALPEAMLPKQGAMSVRREPDTLSSPTVLSVLNQPGELLRTVMVSLAGLDCSHHAVDLFNQIETDTISNGRGLPFPASGIYDRAVVEQEKHRPPGLFSSWEGASRQLRRVLFSFDAVERSNEHLSEAEVRLLSSALAAAVRCCVAASQPEAGVYLAHWVETLDVKTTSSPAVLFRGTPQVCVVPTDGLVSAAIEAFHVAGKSDIAFELVESYLDLDHPSPGWILSYNQAVKLLLDHELSEEAMSLFRKVVLRTRNHDTFLVMAKGLADLNQWKAVADIYRLALTSGCVTEDLSLLAMKAVVSAPIDGKLRVLRNIVGEIVKVVGTSTLTWTESNYWKLKRLIGFSNARSLMYWDDPHTSYLDELELALGVIESRTSHGQAPKTDTLRLVATAAASFHEGYVPPERTGLPRVPRTRDQWVDILARILVEAESTPLLDDSNFVHSVAFAFMKLQKHDEARQFLMDATSRGVRVQQRTIRSVLNGAPQNGSHEDIRLLLVAQP